LPEARDQNLVTLPGRDEPVTPLGAARSDLDAVEALVRKAGTSFYRGMRVLPADRRHAMYAIYAFCRIVDDIADEAGALPDKLRRLAEWRVRVAGLYRGDADGPVTRVLVAAVRQFGLREADFAAVIDGMRMDAETVIVAPDLATLDLYCDRVAAAVGRLSVRAFGDSSAAADKVAWSLGRALQLTNILRDIQEDADRGRLYLPAEYLDLSAVPHDPAAALTSSALPVVCARLAADARGHFREARSQMELCDPAAMKPARLMGETYAAILTCLEQSRWRDPATRVSLPLWRKLWLLVRYGLG
jgi:phytoene synthase